MVNITYLKKKVIVFQNLLSFFIYTLGYLVSIMLLYMI